MFPISRDAGQILGGNVVYVQLYVSFVDASAFPARPGGERFFTDGDSIVIDTNSIPSLVPFYDFPPVPDACQIGRAHV